MKKTSIFLAIVIFSLGFHYSAVSAGEIIIDGLWYQFYFTQAGIPAQACQSFCVPSPGGNSTYADNPPWTFTAPASGVVLTVVDVANSGDVFTIYDFGVEIGSTSFSNQGSQCGLDPEICVQNPNMSKGEFVLSAGNHSITIIPSSSPLNVGTAYFRVDSLTISNIIFIPLVIRD